MDDQEKKKGEDNVRIVDDGLKEVIRLDSPKRVKLEKKGEVAAEKIEAKHRNEIEVVPEEEVRVFDPEEGWKEEGETGEVKVVPMGWFYLLGAGLLGVFCWVCVQNVSSSTAAEDRIPVFGASSENGEGELLGKAAEAQATQDAEAHFVNTERVVAGFLKAATIDERLKFVRHPARVKPFMESYYARNDFKPIFFKQISTYQIFPLENRPFLALTVKDMDGEAYPILLEDGDDGVLVDWESFVCFQPVELADYIDARSTAPTVLRAYVTPDYYHSGDFESRDEYASYRLSFRGSELRLNGYVKRGAELDQRFRKLFSDGPTQMVKPLIVTVRFLEGGKSPRSVLIEDLNSTLWSFATDPAEVASSEK